MRPITRTTICALAAAAIAAPAFAASNYYLKLDNPKGESAAKSAPDKIEILSWSFGATNPATAKVSMQDMHLSTNAATPDPNSQRLAVSDPGASGPKTTSKRQHAPVTISKPLDRGSVTVKGNLPGCTVGARYGGAQFGGGATVYAFKDIMVTSCALDSISFDYVSYRESPTRASQK